MIGILLAATLAAFQPCELRELKAQCGTITVPENRAVAGGRTIDLNVAIVDRGDRPDALVVLAGGPGVAATGMAGWIDRTIKTDHDIVLIDARGTGKSNLLQCAMPQFGELFDVASLVKCRPELEHHADLTQYTTAAIADDVEEVRKRLGYAQMNLYGTSYGTRVALELMRRHPRSLRAVVLDGVVPPTLVMPFTYAADGDRSLRAVFALCRADASCRAAFPNLEADYAKVLRDAEDGVEVTVPERVTIGRGLFGEIMRNFLYSPEVYVRLPLAIHLAANGDWTLFAEMASRYLRAIRGVSYGMFLSVTCTEDIPRLDVAAARRAAANTLLGT